MLFSDADKTRQQNDCIMRGGSVQLYHISHEILQTIMKIFIDFENASTRKTIDVMNDGKF